MMENILNISNNLCKENDAKLIYLVKFGSHLYGTNTKDSDFDYKGIFLPSLQSLILKRDSKTLHYNTSNGKEKNQSGDIDIELFSLQYWLNHLVKKGETIGLDLLFVYTNPDCISFCDGFPFIILPYNIDKLLTSKELMKCAYVKYAIGQAKKYGIKGSRLGVLKKTFEYLQYIKNINKGDLSGKFGLHIDSIINLCGDESYCFKKEVNGIDSLVLCGKVHQNNIELEELYNRVKTSYETYGHRARLAEQNEGIDYKACSHALRAIRQMEQLLATGVITFPLKNANEILYMKQGKMSWEEIENCISTGLANLEEMAEHSKIVGNWDQKFVDNLILKSYGLEIKFY